MILDAHYGRTNEPRRMLADMNLAEALHEMKDTQVEVVPVVESVDGGRLIGVLDERAARRKVNAELVRRQTATV